MDSNTKNAHFRFHVVKIMETAPHEDINARKSHQRKTTHSLQGPSITEQVRKFQAVPRGQVSLQTRVREPFEGIGRKRKTRAAKVHLQVREPIAFFAPSTKKTLRRIIRRLSNSAAS